MQRADALLALSTGFYRRLLLAYPQRHRRWFSEEMQQVFRDHCRDTYRREGLSGFLVLWVKTLADVLITALEERLKEATHMTKEKFIRLGGWSLILGGLIWAFYGLVESVNALRTNSTAESAFLAWYYSLGLLYAIGLLALRARYRSQLGSLANTALLVGALAGLISTARAVYVPIFYPLDPDAEFYFFFFGLMVIAFSLFAFGFDALRSNYLPRWKYLPLITGLPGVLVAILFPLDVSGVIRVSDQMSSALGLSLLSLFGLGSIILGFMLQADSEPLPTITTA